MALGEVTHVFRACSECKDPVLVYVWDLLDWDGLCDECRVSGTPGFVP
jgi:hypothetical protein